MITIHKEHDTIRILKNEKRVYTVGHKTYKCLSKAGFGSKHIVDVIESTHEITLPKEDVEQIKDYFLALE